MDFPTIYTWNKSENHSAKFATRNTEESMTQQSDLHDSDINVILKKYGVGGQLPGVIQPGIYGDFSEVTDYRTAVDMIRAADEAFLEIPAKVREEFGNDPARFMEFAQNPDNLDKMREYGLAPAVKKEENNNSVTEPVRYDDNYEEPNEPQRVQHPRQEGGRMVDAVLPTDKPARTPNIPNGGQQRRP